MYTAPDIIKVSVNVKDVFAAYNCPQDEFEMWVSPCEGRDNYVHQLFTSEYPNNPYQCYSTSNP